MVVALCHVVHGDNLVDLQGQTETTHCSGSVDYNVAQHHHLSVSRWCLWVFATRVHDEVVRKLKCPRKRDHGPDQNEELASLLSNAKNSCTCKHVETLLATQVRLCGVPHKTGKIHCGFQGNHLMRPYINTTLCARVHSLNCEDIHTQVRLPHIARARTLKCVPDLMQICNSQGNLDTQILIALHRQQLIDHSEI